MGNKVQKCSHPGFYTIQNAVYCNECQEYLGYFEPVKLCGFIKEIKDTIEEEYLNEETIKAIAS